VNLPLEFLSPASADAAKAIQWYDRQAEGLGRAFLADLNFQVRRIRRFPESYPQLTSACRRANLQRFPYVIIYRVLLSLIQVIAVFPHRGDLATLVSRTSTPSE
jgi:toxin ParE1/3/4